MDDDDKQVNVSVACGNFWIGVALLIIYFWNGDGIMSLHQAVVQFLTK